MDIIVKAFQAGGNYYLFDRSCNSIVRITEKDYEAFVDIESKNSYESHADMVNLFRNNGLLSANNIVEIEHPMLGRVEASVNDALENVALQVTQNCNFRCEYCIYSGSFQNRIHSNKRLSEEMSYKGIDFLFSHSIKSNQVSIAFYGGEPLLEKELIKKCVQYVKDNYSDRKVTYNLTTNATLLDAEMIDLFVNNNFSILISLDGPAEIHDKGRKFIDKKGTHRAVIDKIEMIKRISPDFYRDFVGYNAVVDKSTDIQQVYDYFDKTPILSSSLTQINYVNDEYNESYESDLHQLFVEHYNMAYFKCLLKMLGLIDADYVSDFFSNNVSYRLEDTYSKFGNKNTSTGKSHHSGPCLPGVSRLFMDVDGNFFPCEKASECSEALRLGDVFSGIDVTKAKQMLNIGSLTKEECKNCWALYHCNICAVSVDGLTELSRDKKLRKCEVVKEDTLSDFKDICTLKDFGYKFGRIQV